MPVSGGASDHAAFEIEMTFALRAKELQGEQGVWDGDLAVWMCEKCLASGRLAHHFTKGR